MPQQPADIIYYLEGLYRCVSDGGHKINVLLIWACHILGKQDIAFINNALTIWS